MRLIDVDAFKADYGMKDDCSECDKEIRGRSKSCEFDRVYTKMDFCGWLDDAPTIEERKTGKWQELYGYVTPGGDPVWCCSECGKGIHVYGIEHETYGADIADGQWVACPNCGAKMEVNEDI